MAMANSMIDTFEREVAAMLARPTNGRRRPGSKLVWVRFSRWQHHEVDGQVVGHALFTPYQVQLFGQPVPAVHYVVARFGGTRLVRCSSVVACSEMARFGISGSPRNVSVNSR